MPLTALTVSPPAPDSSDRDTYDTYADAFFAWFEDSLIPQLNAFVTAFNAGILSGYTGTSVTSHSLVTPTSAVNMTLTAGMGLAPGQFILVARTSDVTKWMVVQVTTYNSGTGVLVGVCMSRSGSAGPFTGWSISPSYGPGPYILTASASLVFTAITALQVQTKTIALTGALVGDAVAVSPDGALGTNSNGICFVAAYVAANDVVTVMLRNQQTTNQTPPTLTWKAAILRQS